MDISHQIVGIPALGDNYIWTIIDDKNGVCAIVDPGEAPPVLTFLEERDLTLAAILITHHHWDHTGGVLELLNHFPDIDVFGPSKEPVEGMTHLLNDGDNIAIQPLSLQFKVNHIPGHTLGHIAIHGNGILFSGDTLFTAGCGKIFEGTPEQMLQSLKTLSQLPDETLVYCGHEYTQSNLKFAAAVEPENPDIQTRIKEVDQLRADGKPTVPARLALEKKTNPFLRTQQKSVINAAENFAGRSLESEVEVLHAIREWKNKEY